MIIIILIEVYFYVRKYENSIELQKKLKIFAIFFEIFMISNQYIIFHTNIDKQCRQQVQVITILEMRKNFKY